MTNPLDRGDNGAVPDPSWEGHWATWSNEAIQTHIAGAARYGVLSKVQIDALLQGLPPPSVGAEPTVCVLAECEAIVRRFWEDVARGHVSGTPTPRELAAWANARGHGLPDPFLVSLADQGQPPDAPDRGEAPGGGSIALPIWVPLVLSDEPPELPPRKVGRPRTAQAVRQALVLEGRRILNAAAGGGRYLPLISVAQELEGTLVAGGKSVTGIKRVLSGKLDVKAAKAKAAAVTVRARKSGGITVQR
jgi:hypothetical protein